MLARSGAVGVARSDKTARGSIAASLLLTAAVANIAPDAMQGSPAAWEYVFQGVETTALWLTVAVMLPRAKRALWWAGLCVCAYGVFESIQRPICRLAFPMTSPPPGGGYLCDMAGVSTSALSMLAVCLVAAAVSHLSTYQDC